MEMHSPFPALRDFHLKVKRLTMICASLALLHPLLSLTHWIFGSLMLPYKSSSHSAKYVRWCDSCSLATPMQGAELNTARQSSHKSPARDDDVGGPPIVISTEAKRSGEISPSDGTGGITVGNLSTQSIMGTVPVCLPYRHVPPLEMTMLASASGYTFGVRVQRVHKVQRVQRVVVAASPQILKKAGPRPPSFRRKPVSRQ